MKAAVLAGGLGTPILEHPHLKPNPIPRYFRATEVETLLGDPTKAREKLGWTPKITFDELVQEMVREDLKAAERDELVKNTGLRLTTITSDGAACQAAAH